MPSKNLEPICYGSSSPVKRAEFELTKNGVKITCENQFKPNGVGLGTIRETSSHITYAQHCREVAKWLNKAAKIMDQRFEERTGVCKKR
jgi:glycine/serine hydroxymethyltransferase